MLNNPQSLIDPSGYSWFSKLFKSIGKIFKKIVHVFQTYIIPALKIVVGGILLATGNPAGFLLMASGGLSFCKSSGCQLGSRITGFLAGAAGDLQSGGGSGGGGSPFWLKLVDDDSGSGGGGGSGSWDASALWERIARFVYGEVQGSKSKKAERHAPHLHRVQFADTVQNLGGVIHNEAQLLPFPPGPKAYGGGPGQFVGAVGGWFVGVRTGAYLGAGLGINLGMTYGGLLGLPAGPLGSFAGALIGGGIGSVGGGLVGGFLGAQFGGTIGHVLVDSPCAGVLNCGEPVGVR